MTTQISYRKGPRGRAIAVDGVVVGAILHRKTKRRKTKRRSQTGWRLVLPSGSRRFKTLKAAKAAAKAMLRSSFTPARLARRPISSA